MANKIIEAGNKGEAGNIGPNWWVGVEVRCFNCDCKFEVGGIGDAEQTWAVRSLTGNAGAETFCPQCKTKVEFTRHEAVVHRVSRHIPIPSYLPGTKVS